MVLFRDPWYPPPLVPYPLLYLEIVGVSSFVKVPYEKPPHQFLLFPLPPYFVPE